MSVYSLKERIGATVSSRFSEVGIANESTKKKRIDGERAFCESYCFFVFVVPPIADLFSPSYIATVLAENAYIHPCPAHVLFVVRISRCVRSRLSAGTACERA